MAARPGGRAADGHPSRRKALAAPAGLAQRRRRRRDRTSPVTRARSAPLVAPWREVEQQPPASSPSSGSSGLLGPPGSVAQVAEQPSPDFVLPSSHCSPASTWLSPQVPLPPPPPPSLV